MPLCKIHLSLNYCLIPFQPHTDWRSTAGVLKHRGYDRIACSLLDVEDYIYQKTGIRFQINRSNLCGGSGVLARFVSSVWGYVSRSFSWIGKRSVALPPKEQVN